MAQYMWSIVYYLLDCFTTPEVHDDEQVQPQIVKLPTYTVSEEGPYMTPGANGEVPMDVDQANLHDDAEVTRPHRFEKLTQCSEFTSPPIDAYFPGKGRGKSQGFPYVTGHLESISDDSDDDSEPWFAPNILSDEKMKERLATKSDTPQVASTCPFGEPKIVWATYGLEVPLSTYIESQKVRDTLHNKMREVQAQQKGAKLCTFSRDHKHRTYAEAYEISSFRQYYLNRLNGPRHTGLSPAQWDFADYCAMREETEQKFFNDFTGFYQIGPKSTAPMSKPASQVREEASSSNEQPNRVNESDQPSARFNPRSLKNFKAGPFNFTKTLEMTRAAASSSQDESSTSSFSLVNER